MARKSLGQNFLYDPKILKQIIQVSNIKNNDLVVEMGPGPGRMTKMLAEKAKKVIAIELDERLYKRLKTELAGYENIELIHGDALKYSFDQLPEFKVVSNIPYYITTPIIFKLLETKGNLKSATITMQKEVADRIIAGPGGKDYGVLSIMVQYYALPRMEFIIPKTAFKPVPKVDSAVVFFDILENPPVSVLDEKFFFKIIKTAFSQRRKMLSTSLKGIRVDIKERLSQANIEPSRRPETLSIEEFARLSEILSRF